MLPTRSWRGPSPDNTCKTCGGEGVIGTYSEEGPETCPDCQGTGETKDQHNPEIVPRFQCTGQCLDGDGEDFVLGTCIICGAGDPLGSS